MFDDVTTTSCPGVGSSLPVSPTACDLKAQNDASGPLADWKYSVLRPSWLTCSCAYTHTENIERFLNLRRSVFKQRAAVWLPETMKRLRATPCIALSPPLTALRVSELLLSAPHLVGIVYFLEALRGSSGTLVPVRVESHRQPAVRPLDLWARNTSRRQ